MAILCIGDVHKRAGDRRDVVRLKALDQILHHAADLSERGDLQAVLWLGDIHHAESGIEDRNVMAEYLCAFGALAPQLIVKGNHDRDGDLDIFARLQTTYPLLVLSDPRIVTIPGLVFACMPYPTTAGLIAAGVPASEMAGQISRVFDVVFRDFGAALAGAAAEGMFTVFAAHITLDGAELSVGQPLIGQDVQIHATHLALLPESTAKVLGHIHKPQTLHGATYAGSIAPVDFGEAERKRFLVLHPIGPGAWEIESVPLDVPPMYHVAGVFDGRAVTWSVTRGPDGPVEQPPATWAGAEVRCRFTFKASDTSRLPTAKAELLADFAEAVHLTLEPVAVPDRAIRAPEVAAAKTTADKLRAYCQLVGLDASEGVLAKLAALEASDQAAVLADLEQRLRTLAPEETRKGVAA